MYYAFVSKLILMHKEKKNEEAFTKKYCNFANFEKISLSSVNQSEIVRFPRFTETLMK